jgi:hypothetical protein
MKILIIHNHYLLPGGEDQVVQDEISMLRGNGHDVVTYERGNCEVQNRGFIRKLVFFLRDAIWSQRTYDDICRLIGRDKPDIAHVHNVFFAVSPSVYDACFDNGVPVVQTLHNYRFVCSVGILYRNGRICEQCFTKGIIHGLINRCYHGSFFYRWCAR